MAITLVWAAAAGVVLLFAADTKVGPVVLRISRAHGIHLGDTIMLGCATLVAAAVTWWLLRRR